MANKIKGLTIIAIVLALMTFCLINNALAQDNAEPLKPFHSNDIQQIPACKYVITNGQYTLDTSANSKLFSNIKAIFVSAVIDGYGANELRAIPFLQPNSLATLAACTLQVRNHITKTGKPGPTYVPTTADSIKEWSEINSGGNLVIRLSAELRDANYQPTILGPEFLILSVRYYRHDVNQIEDMQYDCSEAVPFLEDKDKLQRAVTSTLRNCLYRPPYSYQSQNKSE